MSTIKIKAGANMSGAFYCPACAEDEIENPVASLIARLVNRKMPVAVRIPIKK
jgi:hypothetical protein